jgi:arylsulfate sulfotransferase
MNGKLIACWVLLAASVSPLAANMSVSIATSAQDPVPVGTVVAFYANVSNADAGTLWYRYRVRKPGTGLHVIRDFGPEDWLNWAESEVEGTYEIEATVRNTVTNETVSTSIPCKVISRVTQGQPVISATAHPLVFLYSTPACPAGASIRVQFQDPSGNVQYTPYKDCRNWVSMNFYLAGMSPNTQYSVHHTIDTGPERLDGPTLTLTTGNATISAPSSSILTPPTTPVVNGVLLQSTLAVPNMATDLNGNLLWYYTGNISFITHPEPWGRFLGILQDPTSDASHQLVREFDLAGNTIQETNAARVSEQLVGMGRRPITAFHHDARRLPDGNLVVLGNIEQILNNVQGPGLVDVLGDMIVVLDRNLKVVWAWDAFDHLDPARLATLNETCTLTGGGCPPFYLAMTANDWLHGNAVQFTPDGNLLYSARHQDWLIKILYDNGTGSGRILWRLGKDGDFSYNSNDPYPWFSHQHDGNFDYSDPSKLLVFDNGNVRWASNPASNSRGQVIQLDEVNHVATPVLNADLGAYSFALGSARQLPNGNYHFELGWLNGLGGVPAASRAAEVAPSGSIVYEIQAQTPVYRSFRMQSLYVP